MGYRRLTKLGVYSGGCDGIPQTDDVKRGYIHESKWIDDPMGDVYISYEDYEHLRAEVKQLKEDVRFWNETAIEYKRALNETIRRGPESAGLHIITDSQIDDAWGDNVELQHGDERYIKASAIGIVECPECSGDGAIEPDDPQVICETCMNCHGHGWVREEKP